MVRIGVALLVIGLCTSVVLAKSVKDEILEEQRLEQLLKRVIGGTPVEEGMWPWLVSLHGEIPTSTFLWFVTKADNYVCGASLINKRWILTAAHCLVHSKHGRKGLTPSYWEARLGDTGLKSSFWDDFRGFIGDIFNKDEWKDWVIKGSKIIIHPGYNPQRHWENDIALMKLSEDVPSSPNHVGDIQEIGLAPAGNNNFPEDNQHCIFKGWGCSRSGGRVTSDAFQVDLPKLSDAACRSTWGIDATTRLCAGHSLKGKGICPGDSGGPLVCKRGDTWLQVGIASFTSANNPESYPGVFTRVSAYTDWIQRTIRNN